MLACVTAETRHLDRLGQLGEFEQDSSTDPEQASNTDSHKQSTGVRGCAVQVSGPGDGVRVHQEMRACELSQSMPVRVAGQLAHSSSRGLAS